MLCSRKASCYARATLPTLKHILGYSFFEILVVLSIVIIISTMSMSNYSRYFVKNRRLLAISMILKAASELEIFYERHYSYSEADLTTLGIATTTPDSSYIIRIVTKTADDFVLAIIPQGRQALADQDCGTMTLSAKGIRTITGNSTIEQCWH